MDLTRLHRIDDCHWELPTTGAMRAGINCALANRQGDEPPCSNPALAGESSGQRTGAAGNPDTQPEHAWNR